MKKLLLIFLAFSLFAGCRSRSGSGNIITEKRSVGSFSGLSVSGAFEVEVKNGAAEVTVEADDNLIKYIRTNVENGVLKIKMDHMNVHNAHLKVFVTAAQLNEIRTSAAADVIVKDVMSAENIELNASSAGKIEAPVDAPQISVNASSASEINLSGKTRDLKAECSSASSLKAKKLLSENTTVSVSSGATADVHASVILDANASSGGNISYSGGANVKKSVSSGGSVEKE